MKTSSSLRAGIWLLTLSVVLGQETPRVRADTDAASAAKEAIRAAVRRSTPEQRRNWKIARTASGAMYQTRVLRVTLTEDFAWKISSVDGKNRRCVELPRLLALHPAIERVEAGQSAAMAWLLGDGLPGPVRGNGTILPRIARTVNVILKPGHDARELAPDLRTTPAVERVCLKVMSEPCAAPDDPRYQGFEQWGPRLIGMEAVWDILPRGFVRVAVIDSGVDLEHSELSGRIVYSAGFGDLSTGDAPGDRRNGFDHGTHVAGIIAADCDNGQGIAGMSDYVHLLVMNCAQWNDDTNKYGISDDSDDAMDEAVAQGARVINCSFAPPDRELDGLTYSLNDALDNAYDHDVLVVVAAGNGPDGGMGSDLGGNSWAESGVPFIVTNAQWTGFSRGTPAAPPAGTMETFNPNSWYGNRVNICAPGTDIMSTMPTGGPTGIDYDYKSGTSMAAPHVSGAAALVISMNPNLIDDHAVKNLLERMALDVPPVGKDPQYGSGLLRLDPVVLRTIRNADAFVSSVDTGAQGKFDRPYESIPQALAAVPDQAELCLSGSDVAAGPRSYPPVTITKRCTLTALQDSPVTIGN